MSGFNVAAQQKAANHKQHKKCTHPKLVFIGMQETGTGGKFIPLFNCSVCKTTIAMDDVKQTG